MRNFHVHPNNSNLYQPGVNLDKLWSLVSEQVLKKDIRDFIIAPDRLD